MNRYSFRVSYQQSGLERSVIILAEAGSDAEALRMAHPLADLAQFCGGSEVEVVVQNLDGRQVARVADDIGAELLHLSRQHQI